MRCRALGIQNATPRVYQYEIISFKRRFGMVSISVHLIPTERDAHVKHTADMLLALLLKSDSRIFANKWPEFQWFC